MSSDPRLAPFLADVAKVFAHLQQEFGKLQTGRASAALVEHVIVDAYGQRQPLKNVAGIGVQDARTLTVQPWDPSVMQAVEKALSQADIGATPMSDGHVIRLSLPPLTQERREQMTKVVSQLAEEARISVRKARQTAHDVFKQEKDEDVKETLLEHLQKEVDKANASIDEYKDKKSEELMKV
ncbi:MAG: ribosome recycling factor [Candidatus Peribacteraceae bacterium]|nr:ribosome recycling factor [Candidatus Peribacteraceae bacterium]